jgi:outer membrane protein
MQGAQAVKSLLFSAASIAVGLAIGWNPAVARAQQATGTNIAVVDLAKIFKEHTRFNAMKEDMKRDVDTAEAELKAVREEIQRLGEQLQSFNAGSPDYKNLEARLANKQAELNVQMQLRKKDFLQREAKIYYTIFQEIEDEIKYFAEQNGIGLVLRFSNDEVKEENPDDVLKELNKPIVYYYPKLDITSLILQEVNKRGPAAVAPQGARPPQSVTQAPNRPRATTPGVPQQGAPAQGGPPRTVPR